MFCVWLFCQFVYFLFTTRTLLSPVKSYFHKSSSFYKYKTFLCTLQDNRQSRCHWGRKSQRRGPWCLQRDQEHPPWWRRGRTRSGRMWRLQCQPSWLGGCRAKASLAKSLEYSFHEFDLTSTCCICIKSNVSYAPLPDLQVILCETLQLWVIDKVCLTRPRDICMKTSWTHKYSSLMGFIGRPSWSANKRLLADRSQDV